MLKKLFHTLFSRGVDSIVKDFYAISTRLENYIEAELAIVDANIAKIYDLSNENLDREAGVARAEKIAKNIKKLIG